VAKFQSTWPVSAHVINFLYFVISSNFILNINTVLFLVVELFINVGLCFVCSSCCHHTK